MDMDIDMDMDMDMHMCMRMHMHMLHVHVCACARDACSWTWRCMHMHMHVMHEARVPAPYWEVATRHRACRAGMQPRAWVWLLYTLLVTQPCHAADRTRLNRAKRELLTTLLSESMASNSSLVIVGAHRFGQDATDPWGAPALNRAWARVLLVEANPLLAADLTARRGSLMSRVPAARMVVRNVGVCPNANKGGSELPFYTLAGERLPTIASQMSSFSRATADKGLAQLVHEAPVLQSKSWHLVSTAVRCDTLAAELANHDEMPPPAMLMIDTEGLDCAIVASIDLCSMRPALLVYEHKHCAAAQALAATAALSRCGCSELLREAENVYYRCRPALPAHTQPRVRANPMKERERPQPTRTRTMTGTWTG